jgi:CubicO group peptidase (beta-lactamase class C family)
MIRSSGFVIVMLLLMLTPVGAAEPPQADSLKERVEELTDEYREKYPFGALVVGVIRDGQKSTFGFGEAAHGEDKSSADGRTLFEIGSCTKVFTSLSLAVLVTRGDLALNDTVGKLLPEARLSEDSAAIKLRELSTHTSGLPRLPLGLFFGALVKSDNPYEDYTAEELDEVLASWKGPDQKRFVYSNLGAGLLGYVLQRKIGADDYEDLLRRTVTGPLDLKDTVAVLNDEQRGRLAIGHDEEGNVIPGWDFDVLAGAGALRSTSDDLLQFLEYQLHPETSPLKDAIELTQRPQYEDSSKTIALGWMIRTKDGRTLVWHNGGTGGYRSFFGFERAAGTAVVVLSNVAKLDSSVDRIGTEIMKSLAADRDD